MLFADFYYNRLFWMCLDRNCVIFDIFMRFLDVYGRILTKFGVFWCDFENFYGFLTYVDNFVDKIE